MFDCVCYDNDQSYHLLDFLKKNNDVILIIHGPARTGKTTLYKKLISLDHSLEGRIYTTNDSPYEFIQHDPFDFLQYQKIHCLLMLKEIKILKPYWTYKNPEQLIIEEPKETDIALYFNNQMKISIEQIKPILSKDYGNFLTTTDEFGFCPLSLILMANNIELYKILDEYLFKFIHSCSVRCKTRMNFQISNSFTIILYDIFKQENDRILKRDKMLKMIIDYFEPLFTNLDDLYRNVLAMDESILRTY